MNAHVHSWREYPGDEVACTTCGIEPHQIPTEMSPEDRRAHIDVAGNLFSIRKAFAAARAGVAIWEPRPEPARFAATGDRMLFLDELDMPRPWLR